MNYTANRITPLARFVMVRFSLFSALLWALVSVATSEQPELKDKAQQLPDLMIALHSQQDTVPNILNAIARQSSLQVVAELPEKVREVRLSAKRLPLSRLLVEVNTICQSEVVIEQKTVIVSPQFPPLHAHPAKDAILSFVEERQELLAFIRSLSDSQWQKFSQEKPIPVADLDSRQQQQLKRFLGESYQQLQTMIAGGDLVILTIVFRPRVQIYANGEYVESIYLREHLFPDLRVLRVDTDSKEMRLIERSEFLKIKQGSAVQAPRFFLCTFEPSAQDQRARPSDGNSVKVDKKVRLSSPIMSLDEICKTMRTQAGIEVYVDRRHSTRRLYLSQNEWQASRLLRTVELATKLKQRNVGNVIMLAEYDENMPDWHWLSHYDELPPALKETYERSLREYDNALTSVTQQVDLEKEGIPFKVTYFLKRLKLTVKEMNQPQLAFIQSELAAVVHVKRHFESSELPLKQFNSEPRSTETDLAEAVRLLDNPKAYVEMRPGYSLQIRQYKKSLARDNTVFYELSRQFATTVN